MRTRVAHKFSLVKGREVVSAGRSETLALFDVRVVAGMDRPTLLWLRRCPGCPRRK
jgi:hypothetical protein